MEQRLDFDVAPEAFKAKAALDNYLRQSSIDRGLLGLVKLRASQLNGCAYCVDMHWKENRARDESEQRLYGLDAWRESPYYSEAERAVLAWTEALTRIQPGGVPDEIYAALCQHFDARQVAELTYAVASINAWNRVCIGFRTRAGAYQVKRASP